MRLKFNYKIISEIGGRNNNEDYAEALELGDYYCWIVADGLGGHSSGEIASKLAVKSVIEAFKRNHQINAKCLEEYIEIANQAINERIKEEPEKKGMMTTIVILISDGKKAIWGHVGDTRLYMFRDGDIYYQTKDHTLVQTMIDRGEISPNEVRTHKDRNILLSALGSNRKIKKSILSKPLRLCKGDSFLLCTDGMWEYISEIEMLADLARSINPEEWIKNMHIRVISKAHDDNDNYTAIAIMIC